MQLYTHALRPYSAKVRIALAEKRIDRFERELADGDALCGRFSVADIACFVAVAVASAFAAPPGAEHPRLGAWAARVGARPSVTREFAAMREALAKLPD